MIDLSTAVDTAMANIGKTRHKPVKPVTDAQVEARIMQMAALGYVPTSETVDVVRVILSGRGVMLSGFAGRGKTFLIRCMGIRIYDCKEICEYGLSRISSWYEWTDGHAVCIDDIGSEHVVSEYGSKDELVRAIVAHRSDHQRATTHVTTNLPSTDIVDRYGDRTLSRLVGMCVPFKITGDDWRMKRGNPNGRGGE
jgi:DNA replication protein DnaC